MAGCCAAAIVLPGWNFFEPTIVECPSHSLRIVDTELFGPVLSVIRFKTEEDVIALANDTRHGLAAGIFTRDSARSLRVAKAVRAGIVWVNTYRAISPIAEFGGTKTSGYGRESGFQAIYDYTRPKTVWMNPAQSLHHADNKGGQIMKFHLAVNLERMNDATDMMAVQKHTLEMVQMADRAGFEIAWAAEHHALEMTIAPNPFQLLTWWADHTDSIRLGSGVANAAYWHPINIAGEAAMVDLISGGRLEFGLGSGAYQREFDRMHPGLDQKDSYRYVQEMLPLVRQLWQGDVAHEGDFWQFPAATSCPKPVQEEVPFWVAARSPITFDYAVANDCNIMMAADAADVRG